MSGRTIDYLRISLTDRCNLRCRYCMPCAVPSVPMDEVLAYEEICEIRRTARPERMPGLRADAKGDPGD